MLCREGMDFNHLIRHGIRYLSCDEEKEIRAKETDRADGVREEIIIDEGGDKFLAAARSNPIFCALMIGQKFKNGSMMDPRRNMSSAISRLHRHITRGYSINVYPRCFPI